MSYITKDHNRKVENYKERVEFKWRDMTCYICNAEVESGKLYWSESTREYLPDHTNYTFLIIINAPKLGWTHIVELCDVELAGHTSLELEILLEHVIEALDDNSSEIGIG
tara:strand:- start:216 stop:545 length:330 start_codon:yes stop_codon:yes gene_type:complete